MMSPQSPKSGPRKLSEFTHHLVAPDDIVETGWPAVDKTCRLKLGIEFDDWQHGAGRLVMAQRADGSLAARIDGVGMSLPRQVGKTYLVAGLIFALCVNRPGLFVIWSAHHARTHSETFLGMQGLAKRVKVAPHIRQVAVGSGDEAIYFHNGSKILFGARERGFGRGVPGVDALIFDEAQIMSDKALANMLATLNTSTLGLALYLGTPPRTEDMSEVFRRMRNAALDGELHDGAWIEMSADQGADPDDRKQWAKANPSYPKRTPAASLLRLRRKLTPDDFLREGLGIWDEEGGKAAFGFGVWENAATDRRDRPPVGAVGVATSWDRVWSSIGAAAVVDDETWVWSSQRGKKTAWIVTEAKRIQETYGCPVVVAASGPAGALIPDLEAAGVDVTKVSSGEYCDACAAIYDTAQEKQLRHLPDDADLNDAVMGADARPVGDRWMWGRKTSIADVSMLEAVTLAASAAAPAYDVTESVL